MSLLCLLNIYSADVALNMVIYTWVDIHKDVNPGSFTGMCPGLTNMIFFFIAQICFLLTI